MQLTHPFLTKAHDLPGLLDGCNKLSTYCTRLKKQSTLFPDRYDVLKYTGDGFELFVEALIKLSPTDNRIGIGDYQLVTTGDIGVDGFGIGANGKPATVQVKYRDNQNSILTANADHLTNFTSASVFHYEVDKDDSTNMLIITTASGLHFFTDHVMFGGKVRCINRDQLRQLVDNNVLFWDGFRQLYSEFLLTLK